MRGRLGFAMVSAATSLTLVTGCDSGITSGKPQPPENAPLFNPCDIPDAAITAAGADPATKEADTFGVKIPGWEVCSWKASWYFLTVLASTHTIDEVKSKSTNNDFRAVDIPGRDGAFTHQESVRALGEKCYASFATSDGTTIEVVADKKGSETAQEDVCVVALRSAIVLNDHLPR